MTLFMLPVNSRDPRIVLCRLNDVQRPLYRFRHELQHSVADIWLSQQKPRVQISVVLALTAIAPHFGLVGAQNLDPRLPPSGNFNLSQFTLQLAISPIQIGYSPVGWNDSANFFTDPVDGAMSFSTPSDGNTTEGSHYPRTELRHKVDFWFDRRSTPMLSNRLEVTGRVAALSYTGRMIIGQIHGYDDGSEAVKIYWFNDPKRGGVLYASVKENLGVVSPARGRYAAPFGQQYSYSIEVNANIVTCMLNGYTETYMMNASSWATHNVYFKAGNYLQDNSLPRTIGTVKIYSIRVQSNASLKAISTTTPALATEKPSPPPTTETPFTPRAPSPPLTRRSTPLKARSAPPTRTPSSPPSRTPSAPPTRTPSVLASVRAPSASLTYRILSPPSTRTRFPPGGRTPSLTRTRRTSPPPTRTRSAAPSRAQPVPATITLSGPQPKLVSVQPTRESSASRIRMPSAPSSGTSSASWATTLPRLAPAVRTTAMPTAATSTSDMPFLDPRSPPSGNFNLSQFTLQLAISPVQIGYSPIGWNDSDNFFTDPVDGAMSFSTPSDGNTTEGSHYPRTELRHKVDFWFDRRSTPMLSNRLEVTGRVAALSYTGRMIIGQIHGYDDGSEAVKVYWYNDPKRGGVLFASVKENLGIVSPARGRYAAPFGQKYSYSIEVNANIVTCMLNGYTETYTMNASSWATHNVYFKAGNYLQDNSLPRTVGTVKIYFIKVQNNVNLGASLPPSNKHATVVGASDASHIENVALIVTGCAFTFFGMLACIAIVLQRRSASKRLIVTEHLITAIADVPVLAASSITRSVDIPDLGARVQHGHMRRMR